MTFASEDPQDCAQSPLSRDQRIIALRDEGLSQRAIAAIMDMPPGTVGAALSRSDAITRLPRGRLAHLREIAREVCDIHGITMGEILGPSRVWCIAHPRQKAMAIAYATGRFSLPMLGRFFNRDHTTVLHAVRVHARRLAATPENGCKLSPPGHALIRLASVS